jgi:pyrophosphatase PpaX
MPAPYGDASRNALPYISAMTAIRTVLFDLDGTLIDSVRLILDSYHHTLAAHGLPPRTDDEWLAGVGTPLTAQFAAWGDDPDTLQALIATYRDYNLKHHDRMVTVYPGVVEVVQALKADGVATGLVTSKNRTGAVRGLTLVRLEALMDVLVCADEVENPKPHPEPVEKAVRLLGADPRSTVYVGDSIHDMHSGRAAGVRTAAVLWGPFGRSHLEGAQPDYWLERPEELLALVREER